MISNFNHELKNTIKKRRTDPHRPAQVCACAALRGDAQTRTNPHRCADVQAHTPAQTRTPPNGGDVRVCAGVCAQSLDRLADRVRLLVPSRHNPEAFHIEKSEIEHSLRQLARNTP